MSGQAPQTVHVNSNDELVIETYEEIDAIF